VDEAIHKALAPVAADRFSAMNQLAQAFSASTTATRPSGQVPRPPTAPPRQRSIPVAATTLVLGILIGLGFLFAWRHGRTGTVEATGARRIAVLPFENLGDSADAYFADGMTDEVRGNFPVPALACDRAGSSNEYRRSTKSLQEIGRNRAPSICSTATVRWKSRAVSSGPVSPELLQVEPNAAPTTGGRDSMPCSPTCSR
jgi:hypothetical protein